MPTNPKKRQKKLERLASKRKTKKHQLVRAAHAGLATKLTAAASYPVLDCVVTDDLWSQGLGWVRLSRELPDGRVAYGLFLIDRYCLGVKNAMAGVIGRFTYDSEFVRKLQSRCSVTAFSPAAARKLVEGAVAYAHDLGFHPHPDYYKASRIFGDIAAADCTETFEFGKDGKPLFIAGPNESPARCAQIVRILNESRGADGYHYLMPVSGSATVLPEQLRQDQIQMLGPSEGEMDWAEEEEPDEA